MKTGRGGEWEVSVPSEEKRQNSDGGRPSVKGRLNRGNEEKRKKTHFWEETEAQLSCPMEKKITPGSGSKKKATEWRFQRGGR